MKKVLAFALILLMVATFSVPASAELKDSEAFKAAQRIIESTLKQEGCDDFRFAIIDYNVHKDGDRYFVYSDVKYVNARFKDMRDYFAIIFDEVEDGVELYLLILGTKIYTSEQFILDLVSSPDVALSLIMPTPSV